MKRVILSLMCMVLAASIALCGVNKTLNQAQSMYQNAQTEADYQAAKKKYQSARTDVGYERSEHEAAINQGIKNCDLKINQLTGKLTVNGSAQSTSVSFGAQGGSTTLPVSTNQGTPKVTTSHSWLTVSSVSSTSITLNCSANNGSNSRSATATVTAGALSVHVNVTQDAAIFAITDVEFGSTDYDGNVLVPYGSTLYKDEVCYVSPRFSYTADRDKTKTVYYKFFYTDGTLMTSDTSPSGYSHKQEVTFRQGANKFTATGRGYKTPGNYTPGTYRIEVWIDDKCEYRTNFTIKEKANSFAITDVEFGSTDYDNNIIVPFGNTLYQDEVRFIKPRISYTSDREKTKTVYYKYFLPNGTLDTNDNSPAGYTQKQEITFNKGSYSYKATGWGYRNPGNWSTGTYRYEVWIDGKCEYSTNFTIKARSSNITITNVSFGSVNYDGDIIVPYGNRLYVEDVRFVSPRISYTSDQEQTKTVYYKYFFPDGTLMHGDSSPTGYTSKHNVTFKSGSYNYVGQGRGWREPGNFKPGLYNFEIWIDGNRVYSTQYEIF